MGTVQDIVDGIEDILQSVVDNGLQKLLEVLISGFTLVFSAPAIALATMFNDKPGFIDPLLLPPLKVGYQRLNLLDLHIDALDCVDRNLSLRDSIEYLYASAKPLDMTDAIGTLTAANQGMVLNA